MQIIPSILSRDPIEANKLLKRCVGVVERVSFDIIDGVYADNKTIDPSDIENLETDLKIDFQLMVKEPIDWVQKCVDAKADRIIGHIEQMSDQKAYVSKVNEYGIGVGLGLDLKTPIDKLDPKVLRDLEVILLMSVPAGFGGQEFDPSALQRISELDRIRMDGNYSFAIHDDGGVSMDIVDDVKRLYVDEVSIGRRLFDGDLKENIAKFTRAAYKTNNT